MVAGRRPSAAREEVLEELKRFVRILNESGAVVVVEGESDRRALVESGVSVLSLIHISEPTRQARSTSGGSLADTVAS